MATTLQFDRLNKIENYYEPMAISDRQKKEREELANSLFSFFAMLFADMETLEELTDEYTDKLEEIKSDYSSQLAFLLANHGFNFDKYKALGEYAPKTVLSLINTTLDNEGKQYYYSQDRALNVALNESNRVFNYTDNEDAVSSGYKYKTWLTMGDDRVRQNHLDVDGATIKINGLFNVAGSLMAFPLDDSHDANPNEIIGCRCSIEYTNDDKKYKLANDINADEEISDVEFVDNVDVSKIDETVIEIIEKIKNKVVEHAYIILKSGNIYKAMGGVQGVNFEGLNLDDAIIIHNHTYVTSFGKDDFVFLKNFGTKINYLVSVDDTYTYFVKVDKEIEAVYNTYYKKAMNVYLQGANEQDLQHIVFEELVKDGILKYERIKR